MTTYKDTDLREALRRRYANTPQMPTDFTERMMERMDRKPSHRWHWWYWMPVAACLLIVVGIGLHYELNEAPQLITQAGTSNRAIGAPQLSNRGASTEQSGRPNRAIGAPQPSNRGASTEQSGRPNRTIAKQRTTRRARSTMNPDTLGSGIWRSERNVVIALQMLSECEATIRREEQETRNMVIEATFRATPQPANAVLVTNEAGDYEVIETKTIREI